MKGQSIAAKSLRVGGFGKFSNAGDVSFEVCPAQLQGAFVIAEISLIAVTSQSAGENRAQQLHQNLRAARQRQLIDNKDGSQECP